MNSGLKNILGSVPGASAIYTAVRPGRPRTRYNLEQLAERLPTAVAEARPFAEHARAGTRLLLFATLHYWIEQAAVVGLTLRALGHDVAIAYLPYSSWEKEINPLDLRRQDVYTRRVMAPIEGLLRILPLLGEGKPGPLPEELEQAAVQQSEYDAMYSLQNEQVDRESRLYKMRVQRNRGAAAAALRAVASEKPDVALIPNGLVTELGMFYRTADFLGIPTVTYEFNDHREQIWLAQGEVVMRQNTDALWEARGREPLTDSQRAEITGFERARSEGKLYGKGTRLWQDATAEGGARVRRDLNLDGRPVILLATNVLGDSLTLGRHRFAGSMAEWLGATVRHLISQAGIQLVVRVHPGERLIKGTSMLDVIRRAATGNPENLHIVTPSEKINTYDIMDIASLGLVYTTTVGLEMALRGIPVIVAGSTHYGKRGFTYDPDSWDDYFKILNEVIANLPSSRLKLEQIETAWNYAYRFFFEYPFDFPWRLMHFWKDLETWPLRKVLSDEGMSHFGRTFQHLAGEPIVWTRAIAAGEAHS